MPRQQFDASVLGRGLGQNCNETGDREKQAPNPTNVRGKCHKKYFTASNYGGEADLRAEPPASGAENSLLVDQAVRAVWSEATTERERRLLTGALLIKVELGFYGST